MKIFRWRSLLVAAACLLLLIFGTVSADAATVKNGSQGVSTAQVVMRKKAGVKGAKVTTIKKGRAVQVRKKLKNGWYYVYFNGYLGYVPPERIQPIETARKNYGINVQRTGAKMNMRVAPSNTAKSHGVLPDGAYVTVVGASGNYHKVTYMGKVGYLLKGYFRSNIKVKTLRTTLKFRTAPRTTAAVVSGCPTIPAGSKVNCFVLTNGWWHVKYNSRIGYIADGYFTSNSSSQDTTASGTKKTTANLRLRSSADTSSDNNILTVIPKGSTVTLVAELNSGWDRVKYGGYTGYVSADYLS
ncbi:MAG: SH3 domain-containing protein [Lachnospiraceae bacterium]|nr:SH3 domain-containing protein [Lachnospiraceae bacterium]